jgi:hypothetical protein
VLTARQNSDVSVEAYLAREWEARLRRLLDDSAAWARWTVVVVLSRVETQVRCYARGLVPTE